MALAGALCQTLRAATGFTYKNLHVLMTGLLGITCYSMGPDDLRPGPPTPQRTHPPATPIQPLRPADDGVRIAVFYTKIYSR